ncbi:MAG: hypothetical protein HQ572_05250 [Candidatus Omnitrophica bacterium]|nr:hypothetical protein [Candidatus Omnitrophota bacterium]
MQYRCPVCEMEMPRDLLVVIPHTEEHIVDIIKDKHPEWVESNGLCKKCYEHYKQQLHPGKE